MAILAHFGDQNARAAAVIHQEPFGLRNDGVKFAGGCVRLMVALRNHAGDALAGYQIAVKRRLQRVGDFPQGGANASGVDRGGQQIFMMLRGVGEGVQRCFYRHIVTLSADFFQRGDLLVAHLDVVDLQHRRFILFFQLVLINADDDALALIDQRLFAGGGLFDHPFRQPGLDRLSHSARLGDLLNNGPRLLDDLIGQRLHIIRSGQRIHGAADLRLLLNDDLRITRDAGGKVGGQAERLVKGVGVQRLGAAKRGAEGFDGGTDHVVIRILLGEAPAGGLAVGAQG